MRPPASSDCDGFWKRPKYFPSSGEIQLFPFFTIKIVQVVLENFTQPSQLLLIFWALSRLPRKTLQPSPTCRNSVLELRSHSDSFLVLLERHVWASYIKLFNKSMVYYQWYTKHAQTMQRVNPLNWYVYIFPLFLEAYHTFLQITWPEVEGAWTFDRLCTIWLGLQF